MGKSAAAPKAAAPSQSSAAAAAASQVVVQEIPDKEGFLGAFELFRKAKAPKKVFQVGGCVGGWVDGVAGRRGGLFWLLSVVAGGKRGGLCYCSSCCCCCLRYRRCSRCVVSKFESKTPKTWG